MKKRIEIFDGFWTKEDVKNNSNKIFIFSDNDKRTGKGGQAIIRGLPNTLGIRTKKKPSDTDDSYWSDDNFESNRKKIVEDLNAIKIELMFGKTIVLARGGYGTERAQLKERAPKTFEFLCQALLDNLYFNNETGMSFLRIPSHKEMLEAQVVPMNYEHGVLGYGQESPGYFRRELLESGIFNTFDAIKAGLRTASSRKEIYKAGDLIRVTSDKTTDILICRVIIDSYPVALISKEEWSKLEGWDINYFKLNPGIKDKFQFQFEWICQINKYGKQIFNPRLI